MTCKRVCGNYGKECSPYSVSYRDGARYCSICEHVFTQKFALCPCCRKKLRTRATSGTGRRVRTEAAFRY